MEVSDMKQKIIFKEESPIRSILLLSVGDKFATARNTKEDCEDFAAKLAEAGYKTRIAQHPETGLWTVAIIARSQEAL